MAIKSLDLQCDHCQAEEHYKVGHDDKEDRIDQAIDKHNTLKSLTAFHVFIH